MHQATHQRETKDDRTLDAIEQLAEMVKSALLEREHDTKMSSLAVSSAATVREVLEADAKRARRFGYIIGGAGTAVAFTVIILAVLATGEAKQTEKDYQQRLTEESSKRLTLESKIAAHEAAARALRSERERDRDSLAMVRAKLSETRRELEGAVAELGIVQGVRQNVVEFDRLTGAFVTREEHEQLRDFFYLMAGQLRNRCDQTSSATVSAPDSGATESYTGHDIPAVRKVMLLTEAAVDEHDPQLPFGSLSCDEATHECYLTPSGVCSRK